MKFHDIQFLISAVSKKDFPEPSYPEIAFAGKSNVGKSSMMNCVFKRKSMVKTSSTPGKTRQINFFLVDERVMFVDLPGYGYARVPKSEKQKWAKLVDVYLTGRTNLRMVIAILDIRHSPSKGDIELLDYLRKIQVPHRVVLTKADKLSRSQRMKMAKTIKKEIGYPDSAELIIFSAKTKEGRVELLQYLREISV